LTPINGFLLSSKQVSSESFFLLTTTHFTVSQTHFSQETPEKIGETGDVVEERSNSCIKYNIDLGIALFPWAMNRPFYDEEITYNTYFMQ
jgi:hypothetical protein